MLTSDLRKEVSMNVKTKKRVEEYVKRLQDLYTEIKKWLAGRSFRFVDKNITITEMLSGAYSAPALEVHSDTGMLIATLKPAGAWIIGALGRVDLEGRSETVSLLYLAKGGPALHIRTTTKGDEEKRFAPLFHGVERDGWYWIENARLGRVRNLDAELFFDLLMEISDNAQRSVAR